MALDAERWPADLVSALPGYLAAQRWYSGSEEPSEDEVRVMSSRQLWSDEDGRALWQAVVGVGEDRYQLVLGVRPAGERADFLHGHDRAVLGAIDGFYLYDAVWDADMAKVLLGVVSAGADTAQWVRPLTAEQSNTSLVYDDRLILKVFRRLRPGRNPDVEVTTALAGVGFEHVARPLLEWRDETYDLAFGQQFLAGGTDGWALALTSLRELYSSNECEVPSEAGGDFAAEAERLGRVTAEMHVALHGIYGIAEPGPTRRTWRDLVRGLPGRLERASARADRDLLGPAAPTIEHLLAVEDPGPAIRVHGDFHLGQVMRTDLGWYILDFEGEPEKPVDERLLPASPFKDVTGMLRSLHYASRYALVERSVAEWSDKVTTAQAWESHNRQAFLEGYRLHPGIAGLLPETPVSAAVMIGYELDKALYELEYELSHRPEWVSIPLDALERLVEGGASG